MTPCDNCALRLYNTKSYNLQGVGNPFYGNNIVVPNVDYKAYKNKSMSFSEQVKIIDNALNSSTGEIDCRYYVIPLIRCNETISCEIDRATYNNCLRYFARDVKKYNFSNILLLGSAARRFLEIDVTNNLDNCFISRNNRRYFVNYSPLVQYVSDDLFKTFETKLLQWFDCVINNNFDIYKTIIIQ